MAISRLKQGFETLANYCSLIPQSLIYRPWEAFEADPHPPPRRRRGRLRRRLPVPLATTAMAMTTRVAITEAAMPTLS